MQYLAKILMVAGVIIALAGVILWFFGNKFQWLGNLPGDIKVEKPGFSFYMPITTMILVSVVLSLLLYLWRKFF